MNEVMNSVNNAIMDNYKKTDNIFNDVQNIIEISQKEAYRSVNTILSQRNWLIRYACPFARSSSVSRGDS